MSLEVVKKIAEETGNEELLGAYTALETSQRTNLDRMGYLEKELNTSIQKRDSYKKERDFVKSKFGIEEITEESLEKALSAKGNTSADTQKLEQMISQLQEEKNGIASQFENSKQMNKLERDLISLGAIKETNGDKAFDILMSEVVKGISFENGVSSFKAEDGTTLRNADGTPMSLADRYNQLKESEGMKFLFVEQKPKSGSGKQQSKGEPHGALKRSQMTHSDKAKYISEHGQDAYFKLQK